MSASAAAAGGTLGIAIVGTGYWGKNYVRVCRELGQFDLLYVVDTNPELLAATQRRYPEAKCVSSLAEALKDPALDAVVIATPAVTHHELAVEAISAGKHLIVEKPLATTVADARDLVEKAREAKVVLMCGFTALFTQSMKKAGSMLHESEAAKEKASAKKGLASKDDDAAAAADGAAAAAAAAVLDCGQVFTVTARRQSMGIVRNDVSVVWDLAPHDLAAFTFLLRSAPIRVSAVGSKYLNGRFEDAAFITLTYPDGVVANCHVTWTDPQKQRETVIITSKMRLAIDDVDVMQPLKITNCTLKSELFQSGGKRPADRTGSVLDFGEFVHITQSGDTTLPYLPATEPLKELAAHFAECVNTGRSCIASGDMGLTVVHLLEAIDKSIAAHGAPVDLDPALFADLSYR